MGRIILYNKLHLKKESSLQEFFRTKASHYKANVIETPCVLQILDLIAKESECQKRETKFA